MLPSQNKCQVTVDSNSNVFNPDTSLATQRERTVIKSIHVQQGKVQLLLTPHRLYLNDIILLSKSKYP